MPARKRATTPKSPPALPHADSAEPMSNDLTQYVTTKQAAGMLGVTPDHVIRLLTENRLRGIMPGHDWMVYVPSIEKY